MLLQPCTSARAFLLRGLTEKQHWPAALRPLDRDRAVGGMLGPRDNMPAEARSWRREGLSGSNDHVAGGCNRGIRARRDCIVSGSHAVGREGLKRKLSVST